MSPIIDSLYESRRCASSVFSLFLPAFRDDNVVVFLQHTHTGWPQITTKSDDGFGHKVTLARVFGSDKNGALEVRFVTFLQSILIRSNFKCIS